MSDSKQKPISAKETKRVYITKYALSSGIELRTAEVSEYGLWVKQLFSHFYLGKDAFENEADALADAEKRRVAKIASLQKQIGKMEKLKIRVIDNGN